MNRLLTTTTLLVWGVLLLWFAVTGRVTAYLHPQFHALVAGAGVILLALVPLWWWASRKEEHACAHGCDHDGHDHGGGGAIRWLAFAVLLVPVPAAAVLSPSQFGEAMVMNRGIVTDLDLLPSAERPLPATWQEAPALSAQDQLPDVADFPGEEGVELFYRGADGAIRLEILDLLFAAGEPALREEFEGRKVAIIGQYIPPQGGATGGFDLVRMFVVCCAADARPLGLKITAPDEVEVPRMGWIRITGTARFEEVNGQLEPRLDAESIEPVEQPRETFIH
jgi:uncharacterized repeat protein (TIGR03943 family)